MEIAFFSDIHGNIDGLNAAIKEAKKCGIQKFVALGDYVGYYYNPNQVIDSLLKLDITMIRGNHEDLIFKAIKDKKFLNSLKNKYGHGHEIAISDLSRKNMNFLQKLPKNKIIQLPSNQTLMICHGSPSNINEYIYPDASSKTIEKALKGLDYVAFGHTHYQCLLKKDNNKFMFNPGSIGQPRDKNKIGACWCSFNIYTKKVNFYDTKYDKTNIIKMAKTIDKDVPYLSNVLI